MVLTRRFFINAPTFNKLKHPRSESIYQLRFCVSEKVGKPLIRRSRRSNARSSRECDEGFTVIGKSRGSQDNLSSVRTYILVRRVSLECSGPSRIIVFQERIYTGSSSSVRPLLSLSLSFYLPLSTLTTICFPGDLNLGNGH